MLPYTVLPMIVVIQCPQGETVSMSSKEQATTVKDKQPATKQSRPLWKKKRFIIPVVLILGVWASHQTGSSKQQQSKTATTTASKTTKKPGTNTNVARQTAAQAKANEYAELQALGDWGIGSSKQELAQDMVDIHKSIDAGDTTGGYDSAKRSASQADNWNTQTMNNQDMQNVPSDIPNNVKSVLRNVDPNLAEGYMAYKIAFDDIAEYINTGDMSKMDDSKTNIQIANADFANAQSFIDRANKMLK